MGKTPDKQIEEIEETQQALRESIKEAENLADKAQELLQKHKKTIERQSENWEASPHGPATQSAAFSDLICGH